MPETHTAPDPIPIRPRLRRQSPSVRDLRTKKTRTPGSRNLLPRLLTVETGTSYSQTKKGSFPIGTIFTPIFLYSLHVPASRDYSHNKRPNAKNRRDADVKLVKLSLDCRSE